MAARNPFRSTFDRRNRLHRRRAFLLGVGLALTALAAWGLLPGLSAVSHAVGYAVCHQITDHSFIIGGHQLPLCARCTGTFLGATLSLAMLVWRGRTRASNLPPPKVLAILVLFFAAWAFDGLNSYLSSILGVFELYAPRNWLRLTTGLLNGIAITHLAMPVFHLAIWRQVTEEPSLRGWRELGEMLLVAALAGALVVWAPAPLWGPIALWSALGVVALLTVVNTVLVVVLAGREAAAESWRGLALPLLAALALTGAEIGLINWARAWLSAQLGLPI